MRILTPFGVLFFFAMLVVVISGFWWDESAGHDSLATGVLVAMVAFWSSMFAAGLITCLFHYRQLTILDDSTGRISRASLFRSTSFDVDSAAVLKWRLRPAGGSARLSDDMQRFAIDFSMFDRPDRLLLVRFLRRRVPRERQEGWQDFCHHIAWPLRRSVVRQSGEPLAADEWLLTRRRIDIIFGIGVVVASGIALFAALLLDAPFALTWPLLVIGLWLIVRFSVPPSGTVYKKSEVSRQQRGVVGLGCISISCLLAMLVLEWRRVANAEWYYVAIVVAAFASVAVFFRHESRRDRVDAERAAPVSVAEWEAAEATLPDVPKTR